MTPEPAVSVIVLGYNGREYIEACLGSVLDQDFERSYEVLFVDNASSDGSAEAAARFDGVTVHRMSRNYGFCQGNNIGAALARAPLVIFLNQDVVVHRSWLRKLVAAVESDASVAAAHANVIHPWNPEFATKEREGEVGAAYAPDLSRSGFVVYRAVSPQTEVVDTLFLSGVSLILKRQVIDEIGGYVFDPDMFAYGEDMDLALRLRGLGYRTVLATGAVLYHSHTLQDSISLRSFLKTVRIIRNRLLALWKSSDWPEFIPLAFVASLGAPLNSTQFGLSRAKQALYGALLVPPTAAAVLALFVAMPRYAARRRDVLSGRRVPRWWLFRTLVFDRSRLTRPAGLQAVPSP